MARKTRLFYLGIVVCLNILVPLTGPLLSVAGTVAARLYQTSETTTIIEINLSSPTPPTLIVEMNIPPGIQITETTPEFSKQNKNNNKTKWLLKNVKKDVFVIKLVTKTKLDLGSTEVHVRYRDSASGALIDVRAIKPK